MLRNFSLLGVLLLLPAGANAASNSVAPEQFFSDKALFYFRYDGIETHRRAFDRSAMGEVLNSDLGVFLDYLINTTRNAIGPSILKDRVLDGAMSQRLQQVRKGFKQTPDFVRYLFQKGFVIGGEVISLYPYRAQIAIVFPDAGDSRFRDAVQSNLRLIAALAEVPIKETKSDLQTVAHWDLKGTPAVKVSWWQEENHLVFTVGTEDPAYTQSIVQGKRACLLESALYRSMQSFNEYETVFRGFVDLDRPLKLARTLAVFANAGQYIDMLGLGALQTLTMHFGFEGKNTRTTFLIQAPGKRRGLFDLSTATDSIRLDRLPPLPPDMSTLYAVNLDPKAVYDLALRLITSIAEIGNKQARKDIDDGLQKLSVRLGVDLRKDLLGNLGSTVIAYNSPSEGPLSMGFGLALEVKDAARVQAALESLFKSLSIVIGEDVSLKKRQYHGVDLCSIKIAQEGFLFVPTFAVHDRWLVMGLFPQTVQGYVLRATGKRSCWEPTQLVHETLRIAKERSPKARVSALMISDPRPTVRQFCSVGPFIGGLAESFDPGSFDVKMLPNAQAVAEPLYPNVSVVYDNGQTIRLDSYSSFAFPFFDFTGADGYLAGTIAYQIFKLQK